MQGPVFVVGTMRSGSTMFRLVLDSHPNIAISEETGFMGALTAARAIPNWQFGREWYQRIGWSEEELDTRLREFYSGMFERFADSQGKKRWGEKTPFHSWHIAEMARVFPDAVFVCIVRHPGAVASSLRKHFNYTVDEATSYWENTNTEILRQGAVLGERRFAVVRYEDLVARSEPTLRALVGWLDEPWSDAVLRHHDIQSAKGAPRITDGRTKPADPLTADRAVRWAATMAPSDKEIIWQLAGPLAEFLGYDADDALEPECGDGGWDGVLTGTQLALRQRDWSSKLTFDARERGIVAAEMGREDLLKRLQQAETSLARIRSRRSVRLVDTVRRAQRLALRARARDLLMLARGVAHERRQSR